MKGQLDLNRIDDIELVQAAYSEWVLDDLALVLRQTTETTEVASGRKEVEVRYLAVKARKRGNDIDAHFMDQRMRPLADVVSEYCEPPEPGHAPSRTRAVYVTGTVDSAAVGGDVELAWKYLPVWFNRFLANLRKHFGTVLGEVRQDGSLGCHFVPAKIRVVRSWEAHDYSDRRGPGWPHVHAILCFEDFSFGILKDAKNPTIWRVKQRADFAAAWGPGWIDVQGLTLGTAERGILNVLWYVSKNRSAMDYRMVELWPRKRRLTQSILWYYGMRSYSVSRDFFRRDDSTARADLIGRTCITQTALDGSPAFEEFVVYEFIGLVRRIETELGREDWETVYDHPPDWLDRCWDPHAGKGGLGWASTWGGA